MIFISVVSHGHFQLIKEIGCLDLFSGSNNLTVLIRDNVGEAGFYEWCNIRNFSYYLNKTPLGFGENNNLNFAQLKFSGDSFGNYFLVLNPDVYVTEEAILELALKMKSNEEKLGTINLFLDVEHLRSDNCVRRFPKLRDFISSFVFGNNGSIIDKSSLEEVTLVDWAAGSFLMFELDAYSHLKGFDEGYFMYCEDIDICKRYNNEFGSKLLFCRDIFGVHFSGLLSRKLFSKHFVWHLKSVFRYLMKRP